MLPLCPPPPAAPLRPAPVRLRLMWDWDLCVPCSPLRDTGLLALQDKDAPLWKKELIFSGSHPSSCLPVSLRAAPRDREIHNQPQLPALSPTPFLQSIKKVLLRQKGA